MTRVLSTWTDGTRTRSRYSSLFAGSDRRSCQARVGRRPVRHLLEEGHEIANRMTRDERSIELPPDEFPIELAKAHQALSAFGPVRWFRAGGGRSTAAMRSAARQLGCRTARVTFTPSTPTSLR